MENNRRRRGLHIGKVSVKRVKNGIATLLTYVQVGERKLNEVPHFGVRADPDGLVPNQWGEQPLG